MYIVATVHSFTIPCKLWICLYGIMLKMLREMQLLWEYNTNQKCGKKVRKDVPSGAMKLGKRVLLDPDS